MARRPREDAPGHVHHVMARGIERRPIFVDDVDREDLLRRLSLLIPHLGFRCYAWCLMPNHLHLVVRSGTVRISRLMARVGTGYAARFNSRHRRVGHLFQNRFRSRPVVDDADLQGVVLYVVRNPLEAGLVQDANALEDFPWCALGALLGRRPPRPFESVPETLGLFGDEPARAQRRVRSWLGSAAAVHPARPVDRPAASEARKPLAGDAFESLVAEVCRQLDVEERALVGRERPRPVSAARREIARRAAGTLGLSAAEIARRLGVTRAAVSLQLRDASDGERTS